MEKDHISHLGATSIEYQFCEKALRDQFADEKKKRVDMRLRLPFKFEEYAQLLSLAANRILLKRGENSKFLIDESNRSCIEQLYYYLTCSDEFIGDLNKGIMLMGKYGSGKSLIWEAVTDVYNTSIEVLNLQRPVLRFIKSTDLQSQVMEKGIKEFLRRPLVIDEFGREPKNVMIYGNTRSPLIELLCARYDAGAWTHGTSNFTLDTLASENYYGQMTGDRLRSMLNFIELKGNSRRK